MPISEYILLALLATGGIAVTDGNGTTTLGAEAIAQPNGGASSAAHERKREEPKKDGGGKITAARSKGHRKHKRRVHKEGTTPPAKTTGY